MNSQPVLEITCKTHPVLPLRDFIRYVWRVIGSAAALELHITSQNHAAPPLRSLTIHPCNILGDSDRWLIITKNDKQKYELWQEGESAFIRRCK